MQKYYVPSGKFSPISLVLFLVLCFTAFPLLGALYTYAIWYIPFIYVNFLITAGFGFAVGILIRFVVIKMGKVRSIKLAIALAGLGGLAAIYAHWVVWADLVLNATETYGTSRIGITVSSTNFEQLSLIAVNPSGLFGLMEEVNQYGSWALFGQTVSGVFLAIIWIIESLIILVLSIIIGIQNVKDPFCERSNSWFKHRDLPPMSHILFKDELVADLERGSDAALAKLHLRDLVKDNGNHSVFTIYYSDLDEQYLTIQNKIINITDKGDVEYKDDTVIERIEISQKTANALDQIKHVEVASSDSVKPFEEEVEKSED